MSQSADSKGRKNAPVSSGTGALGSENASRSVRASGATPPSGPAGVLQPTGAACPTDSAKPSKPAKSPKTAKVSVRVSAAASVPASQVEAERESMGTVRKSLLFLAAVGVAYAAYLIISGQLDEFLSAMGGIDRGWVVAAALCYVVYYAFGVSAYVMAVISDPTSPVGIRDLMSVEASGIFFGNLTPNGAGGAPSQIFRLTRAGLSMGGAGALQYTRFIVYEAGEGIFAALMLLFRWQYFLDTYGNVVLVGALLFGFKVVEVAGLLVVCLWPHFITRVGNALLRFLRARGWLSEKSHDHWHEVVNSEVNDFSAGFRVASKNVAEMIATLVVTLIQLGCLYALPYFVLRAFGQPADLITCLACGSMLELLTSAIPLPGGTGGAEGGFAFLFAPMFGSSITAGYVVWRMVEYFLPVLVAVPLLGLRSHGGPSIHVRWKRLRSRLAGVRRDVFHGRAASRVGGRVGGRIATLTGGRIGSRSGGRTDGVSVRMSRSGKVRISGKGMPSGGVAPASGAVPAGSVASAGGAGTPPQFARPASEAGMRPAQTGVRPAQAPRSAQMLQPVRVSQQSQSSQPLRPVAEKPPKSGKKKLRIIVEE